MLLRSWSPKLRVQVMPDFAVHLGEDGQLAGGGARGRLRERGAARPAASAARRARRARHRLSSGVDRPDEGADAPPSVGASSPRRRAACAARRGRLRTGAGACEGLRRSRFGRRALGVLVAARRSPARRGCAPRSRPSAAGRCPSASRSSSCTGVFAGICTWYEPSSASGTSPRSRREHRPLRRGAARPRRPAALFAAPFGQPRGRAPGCRRRSCRAVPSGRRRARRSSARRARAGATELRLRPSATPGPRTPSRARRSPGRSGRSPRGAPRSAGRHATSTRPSGQRRRARGRDRPPRR